MTSTEALCHKKTSGAHSTLVKLPAIEAGVIILVVNGGTFNLHSAP